jgi:hypothetical protein
MNTLTDLSSKMLKLTNTYNQYKYALTKKKQLNPAKDFGYSAEVEKLHEYIETNYKRMLKRYDKKEVNYFEELNRISEEVSSEFDSKIIELTELNLEHRFKDNLLFKFFIGAFSPFVFQFFYYHITQIIIKDFHGNIPWGSDNLIPTPIPYLIAFLTLVATVYLFWNPNNRINKLQRILKYALILQRHNDLISQKKIDNISEI